MPVKVIIHEKKGLEQAASRVQTQHLTYKSGIWCTKLAFRLQICSFQFTNKHLALQTGVSDYNSALDESDQAVVVRMVSEMAAARDDERYKAYQDEYSLIQFSATRPAAGSGNEFVDDIPTYRFVRNNDRSMNADILIQISGRSMEPRYYDGDIVYAKYTNSAEDGQDVICSTADGAVIKHKSGNKLVSLNSDLPYGEKSEDDHVQIEAVVLGIVPSWDLAKPEEIDMLEEAHRKEVRAFKDKYGLEY